MWRELPLGNLATINSGGTPSTENAEFWGGDIPWVTPTDITACKTNYLFHTASQITKKGLHSCSAKLLPAGSILFTSRATVGVSRIAGIPVCTNQGFKSLTSGTSADGKFLFYQVQRLRSAFERYAAGSTFPEINKKDTARVLIPHPADVRVQQKIATILSTVDTAIEQTEALIEKYQHIKAGLMHDLFTRGVLLTGQLRPPREQAPELYQETAIGWIPREWIFTNCDAVCEQIIDCKNRTPPETPDGHPAIRTPNVRNGEFVDKELLFTDARSYAIWTARGKPKVGDVVIAREAPVGEVCMIPERHPEACLGQRMMLYRPNKEIIDSNFFLFALQSRQIQNRLDLISGGSTVGHVRVGDIRSLWMFMPKSKQEQQLIAATLSQTSERLRTEQARRDKLQTQKLGLMQDLLTGKVAVTTAGETAHGG